MRKSKVLSRIIRNGNFTGIKYYEYKIGDFFIMMLFLSIDKSEINIGKVMHFDHLSERAQ